jgi:YHS domain-containing protein
MTIEQLPTFKAPCLMQKNETANDHFCIMLMTVIDPVCGIEMLQELAITHEHHGKTYYFCCEGCKRLFTKKPGKYSK